MGDEKLILSVLGAAWVVILGLVGAMWAMLSQERKNTADAIAKTASSEALREAKENFLREIERTNADFNQKLAEQRNTHDRDMDRMRVDLDKIILLIGDVSKKVDSYNKDIMEEMQAINISIASITSQKK